MSKVQRTSSSFLSKILDGIKYIQSLFISAWNNLIGFFRNLFSASSAHESSRAPTVSTPLTTLDSKSETLEMASTTTIQKTLQAFANKTPIEAINIIPCALKEAQSPEPQSQLITLENHERGPHLTLVAPNHFSNVLCYSANCQKQLFMVGFILSCLITYWALSGSEVSDTSYLPYPS